MKNEYNDESVKILVYLVIKIKVYPLINFRKSTFINSGFRIIYNILKK